MQLDKAGIRDLDPIFPRIAPGPHGVERWNGYGEREAKRWCVATEDRSSLMSPYDGNSGMTLLRGLLRRRQA